MPDCLAAGIIVADHICAPIDHMPAPGELTLSPHMQLELGGCASNVAVDLACLGVDVGIVGRIGRDVFGNFVRDELLACGVNCDGLLVSETSETSGSLVLNVSGEDRRFIHTVGANAEFTGNEIDPAQLKDCRVLYLGGYCLTESLDAERVRQLFRQARQAGVRTVLDVVIPAPGDYWSRLDPVLPETDFFLPNDDEGRLITGFDAARDQALAFRDRGASTVIVTCGGSGCELVGDSQRLSAGAIPTEPIDGTGSGDAFVAGFIHGLLRGASLEESLHLGTALGARTVASIGATGARLSAGDLDTFAQQNPIRISAWN